MTPTPLRRQRVALLVCSTVLGGHEFQAAALARDLVRHVDVTVYANKPDQCALFEAPGVAVELLEDRLLGLGTLPRQIADGFARRRDLRRLLAGHDHIVVSAGAVEAGVAAAVALRGLAPLSLYLPFFFDRRPLLGALAGGAYNALLAACCRLFTRIVTINRIQARVIRSFSGLPTAVVTNDVRPVAPPVARRPGQLVFVGRLHPQKRIDELLAWLDFEANPYREILLIGDGPSRAELEAQARTLSHLRCTFAGWMSAAEQDAALCADDVLVLNSLLEGEPLVIREATRRGMRVLARDIVGVRGVTLPRHRYADAQGLRRLLARLPAEARDEHPPASPEAAEARRLGQVARLAATFA